MTSKGWDFDVAVVGGGPGGSSVATALTRRGRSVVLLERERFPRFHIGESQLPWSNEVIRALGAEAAIAAAGFVRKWGASFRRPDGGTEQYADFQAAVETPTPQTFQVLRERSTRSFCAMPRGAESPCARSQRFLDADLRRGRRDPPLRGRGWRRAHRAGRDRGRRLGACRGPGEALRASRVGSAPAQHRGPRPVRGDPARRGPPRRRHPDVHPPRHGLAVVDPALRHGDECGGGDPESDSSTAGAGRRPRRAWRIISRTRRPSSRCSSGHSASLPRASTPTTPTSATRMAGDRWVAVGDAAAFLDPIFSTGVLLAMQGGLEAAEAIDVGLRVGDLSARASPGTSVSSGSAITTFGGSPWGSTTRPSAISGSHPGSDSASTPRSWPSSRGTGSLHCDPDQDRGVLRPGRLAAPRPEGRAGWTFGEAARRTTSAVTSLGPETLDR